MIMPLQVHDGATPSWSNTSMTRQMPIRWPYSRQVQFAVSSTSPGRAWGIVAGPPGNIGSFWPGRDGSQYSMLMVKISATFAPFGNFNGARSGSGTKS